MTRSILAEVRLAAAHGAVLLGVSLLAACGGGSTPTTPSPTQVPQVFSVTPSKGGTAGGTAVRITGANFAGGATVTIGGVSATEVVVESATSITAKTGAHAAGTGDIVVTVAGKSGSLPAGFSYEAPSAPPVITSLTARGTRPIIEPDLFADLGEEISVTAVVQDPDTSINLLTYEWSAESGTFTGTGATVKWKAPGTALTPSSVRLTVIVVDGPNRVPGTVTISLHDSAREVGDMAREFLLDFSNSSSSPTFVVRNFSTSTRCKDERESELADVTDNRAKYTITASTIGAATVNFSFAGKPCSYGNAKTGDACAVVPAFWQSIKKSTGGTEKVDGRDYVGAVYEQGRWLLCSSYFEGTLLPSFIR